MFVVLYIFCYEETCSFWAHFTTDVPISSTPFCLSVCARHMWSVPTALLHKIFLFVRQTNWAWPLIPCEKRAGHTTPYSEESPATSCGTGTPGGQSHVPMPTKWSLLCVAQLFQMEMDTDRNWNFPHPKSCIVYLTLNSQKVPVESNYNFKVNCSKL